ncbi:YdcF family protein [Magnetovibrio sp.]|uniref:YdcF family protein n=1 Tax=Magnetovibrio sp. TaxID=2024836 RepID=UPI002F934025
MDVSSLTFVLTRILAFALNPVSLFIAGLLLSLLLMLSRHWAGKGRVLLGFVLLNYIVFAIFPVGVWAVNKLEDRFSTVRDYPGSVAGILVLAGSVNTVMTRERDQVAVGGNIERLTEFMRLARAHPEAKLVYVGGQGRLFDRKPSEAEVAERFLRETGLDTTKVWFEDRSRNTEEGALMSYRQLQPGDQPWVLITSARHMPRAVGLFRKAGWTVLAHPTDYLTLPGEPQTWAPTWPGGLGFANEALYEWAGLAFSWLRGKIDEPFPGPFPAGDAVAQVSN